VGLREDGSLWAWGANPGGQLGVNSSNTRVLKPQPVAGPTGWRTISAGLAHTVGVRTDGTLWAWGANGDGQIALGTNLGSRVPIPISADNTWVSASAGIGHTVALRSDGTLWGAGRNDAGQLAQASTNRVTTLRQIETNSTWCAVAAGERHTLALRSDGAIWAWGANSSGQLGNGTFIGTNQPQMVAGSREW